VAKPKAKYRNPYLDASVFIGWINNENVDGVDRKAIADDILKAARDGKLVIHTSTLTIAEVHKLRGKPRLNGDKADSLLKFFESDFIHFVDLERRVAEEAHRLCRDQGLYPNDGIHLASALQAKCEVLLVWDDRFAKANLPTIRIEEPQFAVGQLALAGEGDRPDLEIETEEEADSE